MRTITIYLVLIFGLLVSSRVASADRWSSKGWVKLGEQTVNGRVDRDRITVGRYEGKFSKLTLVVEASELELLDFEVTFGNNQKWNPRIAHYFRENTRTRVIDLPGDDRVIKYIDLKYKNVPGGGRARVEVWGWKAGANDAPTTRAPWRFDSTGWQLLGENIVNGRVDKDRITVGKYNGRFSKMTIVVLDSDLELLDLEVQFARGPSWHPTVRHVFREGERSRVIDFPGDERAIRYIDLKYKNLPGGGRAKVQVYAK
jgi:hypothetical protein